MGPCEGVAPFILGGKMVQTAIGILQSLGIWGAIQAAVAITVAWVLYERFVRK